MKRILTCGIALGLINTFVCSCGGGSSDGSSPRNVSGQWQGAVTRVSDTCGGSGQTVSLNHSVSQNQGAVELKDGAGVRYLGNVVGEDGFSVDGARDAGDCNDRVQIEYNSINEDDDGTATVDFKVTRSCSGMTDCQIEYTGTVSRAINAQPVNTPGSQATTVPVAGGCSSMNPNPASGEYSGDGGCGISAAALSFSSANKDTVILEPFGANGATSFAVTAPGSVTANSSRADLTILGTAGYSCSLTCSAPGTFTASCFKEGGATCIEKF